MSGSLWLDWALISVSLFNTIALLWLGLTVLLNVERRGLGVWLMGGGLLAATAFFISHTAILGHDTPFITRGADFWWQVSWVPIVAAPLAWYVVNLWYVGFWSEQGHQVRRHHLPWLVLAGAIGVSLLALTALRGLPSFTQVAQFQSSARLEMAGVPLLFLLYPVFLVGCFVLAVDALRHPAPSERLLGDLARQRTRPWLVGAAIVLVVVSLLVATFLWWGASIMRAGINSPVSGALVWLGSWLDLGVGTLIAVAVLLMGRGIVAYELFTGHTLPRRGFVRHWRSAVTLAAGYGVLIGWSIAFHLRPVYSLLLTTILMVTFYALFGWRSFVEREQFMARLRPFVGSQRLVESLLSPSGPPPSRAQVVFQALCHDVLGTQQAQLVPLGALAPLAGGPLCYPQTPDTSPAPPPVLPSVKPEDRLVPLASQVHAPFRWAVPLWAERGLIGAILLGDKPDSGLYAQEEIEIAHATGERIVDMLAGEEMARRLVELQRRRLAETQIADRRTRRALHDEVLPELHAAILQLGALQGTMPGVEEALYGLMSVHHQVADLIRNLPHPANSAPDGDLAEAIRQMLEGEFAAEFEGVSLEAEGHLPPIYPMAQEVIYHAVREAVRNAALHGRGGESDRPLHLRVQVACERGERLTISVTDDGVGLYACGQSRAAEGRTSGAQGGLALHSTLLAIIGGSLTIAPAPQGGTCVTVALGLSDTPWDARTASGQSKSKSS